MGQNSSKENFLEDVLRPEHIPLTGQDALRALYRAETMDSYRERVEISPTNRIARKTLKYLPALHTNLKEIPKADKPWPNGKVIWMDPDSDNGLPHTRPPNLICLPSTLPDSSLASTLLHERVHLSQRLHSVEWDNIFKNAWSMTPWKGSLPPDIQLRRRINPDLILVPFFQWKKQWVPVATFKSLTSPMLNDVDIVWWDTIGRVVHRDPPLGWVDFFGTVDSGHEHPYELSAYMIEHNSPIKAFKALEPLLVSLPTNEL